MIDQALLKVFTAPISSPEHMRHWVYNFFGIDLPLGHVDPDSNSSPAEWVYEAYDTYRNNMGDKIPGFIILSSRESYKTLSEATLAVVLMVHFGCTIAHLAAIEPQANKAIQYVTTFVTRIKPYLASIARSVDSQSRRQIKIKEEGTGSVAYVNIIIATLQGANSEHTNILSIDEIDVMRFPKAYDEAKLIPGMMNGQYPLTIKTSTRKFAFGLMEKEIQNAAQAGDKLLRWNIIDVTEKCPDERHRPDLPKVKRFIHPRLPFRNLDEQEFKSITPEKRIEYKEIEAFAGCATCPLLPVCRTRLATRPAEDHGGLYKPIPFTINQFKKISPDMAEAQLLCWKPSSSGLVYPRFDDTPQKGNILTLDEAWEKFTGAPAPEGLTLRKLTDYMLVKGVQFDAGVDWGFRHAFAILVACQVLGEWWLVDSVSIPGLEYEQMIAQAEQIRDTYRIRKWYADTSQPMFIAGFKRRKMPCVKFKKDVMGGIEATRGQVVDAFGNRRLKVLKHEQNEFLINGFRNHHFKLDSAGNPTLEPDDEEYADIMDSVRYPAQNLFAGKKSVISPPHPALPDHRFLPHDDSPRKYEDWMSQKIRELAQGQSADAVGKSDSGTVLWDFSGSNEDE